MQVAGRSNRLVSAPALPGMPSFPSISAKGILQRPGVGDPLGQRVDQRPDLRLPLRRLRNIIPAGSFFR